MEINNNDGKKYKANINLQDHNTSHYKIFNLTNKEETILDVGCACGDIGYILHKYKKCKVYGIENNHKSIEIAHSQHVYEQIWECDLNNINLEKYTNYYNYFDCIIFGDILEHLYNPKETLSKLLHFLKIDGSIILSIPNIGHSSIKALLLNDYFIYTPTGLLDNTHIRFFTKNSIILLLTQLGLQINKCEAVSAPLNGTYPIDLYNKINDYTLISIYKNKFSHVFQFILKCNFSKYDDKNLLGINTNKINNIKVMKSKRQYINSGNTITKIYIIICAIIENLKTSFK